MNPHFTAYLIGILSWILLPFIATAGPIHPKDLYQSPSIEFAEPSDFFQGQYQWDRIPELSHINSREIEQLRLIENYLRNQGIPLSIGRNSNRGGFFDLYTPTLDVQSDQPQPLFANSDISGMGRAHFVYHDSVHLYLGGIQVRPSDVDTEDSRAKTKERLIRIILKQEALASAWTVRHYLRWYWAHKADSRTDIDREKFDQYNQGGLTFFNVSDDLFMDLMLDGVLGNPVSLFKNVRKVLSYDYHDEAVNAGLPDYLPNLEQLSSLSRDSIQPTVEKYLAPAYIAFIRYFVGSTSYLSFRRFAKDLADYYMSPEYVEWSSSYNFGHNIDDMDARLNRIENNLRQGKLVDFEPLAPQDYQDLALVHQAVKQFGRKLIEVKRPAHLEKVPAFEQLMEQVHQLNSRISQKLRSADSLENITAPEALQRLQSLYRYVEAKFPIELILPRGYLPPTMDPQAFWRDPFATVVDRGRKLEQYLGTRTIHAQALYQLFLDAKYKGDPKKLQADPEFYSFQNSLAKAYSASIIDRSNPPLVGPTFADQVRSFHWTFSNQIDEIAIPFIEASLAIEKSHRIQLIKALKQVKIELGRQIEDFIRSYRAANLANKSTQHSHLMKPLEYEFEISFSVNLVLERLTTTIQALGIAEAKSLDQKSLLGRWWESLTSKPISKRIAEDILWYEKVASRLREQQTARPSLSELVRIKGLWRELKEFSFAIKTGFYGMNLQMQRPLRTLSWATYQMFIRNRPMTEIIEKLSAADFIGDNQVTLSSEFKSRLDQLPDDAVIVVVGNHDYLYLDGRSIIESRDYLNAPQAIWLANASVYPQFALGLPNRDPNLLDIADRKWRRKLIDRVSSLENQRVVFSVFPTGQLSLNGAQLPLSAKSGAFHAARTLAHTLGAKKRKVYLVNLTSNSSEYVEMRAKGQNIDYQLKLGAPQLVPSAPVTKPDFWVDGQRLAFQRNMNQSRGGVLQLDQSMLPPRHRDPSRDLVSKDRPRIQTMNQTALTGLPGAFGGQCKSVFQ